MVEANSTAPSSPENRRRSKWVPGNVQLKNVLLTFSVATFVLILNLHFTVRGLWLIYENAGATQAGVVEETQAMLIKQFIFCSVAAIFLSIWVGLTHYNLWGPIYRFKRFFQALPKGRWDVKCTLRDGDNFQETKEAINTAVGLLTETIRTQHETLQEARRALEDAGGNALDRSQINALRAKIDAAAAEFAQRFGEQATRSDKQPELAGAGVEAQSSSSSSR